MNIYRAGGESDKDRGALRRQDGVECGAARAGRGERPAGRAQLLAKRGSTGQLQTPAELVPIPDASGMRRDFEFRQISANSGGIPANVGKSRRN